MAVAALPCGVFRCRACASRQIPARPLNLRLSRLKAEAGCSAWHPGHQIGVSAVMALAGGRLRRVRVVVAVIRPAPHPARGPMRLANHQAPTERPGLRKETEPLRRNCWARDVTSTWVLDTYPPARR